MGYKIAVFSYKQNQRCFWLPLSAPKHVASTEGKVEEIRSKGVEALPPLEVKEAGNSSHSVLGFHGYEQTP